MKALIKAADEIVIRELFEPTEDGLRLKYLLGVPKPGGQNLVDTLAQRWVSRVRDVADTASEAVASVLQDGPDMSQDNASAIRELIEDEAEESDGLAELVTSYWRNFRDRSDIMCRAASAGPRRVGRPRGKFETSASEREQFIKEVKRFTGNLREDFGKLVTPLVNGMRIAGPFFAATGGVALSLVRHGWFRPLRRNGERLHEDYTGALRTRGLRIDRRECEDTRSAANPLHQVLEAAATTGRNVKKLAIAFTIWMRWPARRGR